MKRKYLWWAMACVCGVAGVIVATTSVLALSAVANWAMGGEPLAHNPVEIGLAGLLGLAMCWPLRSALLIFEAKARRDAFAS